ncbi:MAG: hypothetical protein DRG58_06705 [Deltaproteobacteria bacterium]|nr:MAG: hypothetical protein DRG58_06705 [Deltaproteobacteria bacterium]
MIFKRRKKPRACQPKPKALEKECLARLTDRLKKADYLPKALIIKNRSSKLKMSQVILDFAEPFLAQIDEQDDTAFREVIDLAILGWNLALLTESGRQELLDKIMAKPAPKIPRHYKQTLQKKLDALIQRKQRFFADYRLAIIDYEIIASEDHHVLTVVTGSDFKF